MPTFRQIKIFLLALATFIPFPKNFAAAKENEPSKNWPSFRNGSSRNPVEKTTATPKKLFPAWKYSTGLAPNPAWDAPGKFNRWRKYWLSSAWNYDDSFQTVIANGKVFFCSSADCAVRCLDLKTGKLLWIFWMEAPGHLAPMVAKGRCYAPSDDGFLYCLDAETGKSVWKYSPNPNAPRVPCDGWVISTVPIRCGAAISNGTVYLAAGLFPMEGTYLCALDAATGKEKFAKKTNYSPQGYIALTENAIIVPNGRAPTVSYDRATGKQIGVSGTSGAVKRKVNGGAYAAVLGEDQVVVGPTEAGTMWIYRNARWRSSWRVAGLQLLDDGENLYLLEKNAVSALNRTDALTKKKLSRKWSLPMKNARTMIKVGDALFVGGENFVTLVNASSGKAVWGFEPDGVVSGLAYGDGHLVASSSSGTIYCFSITPTEKTSRTEQPSSKTKPDPLANFLNSIFKRGKGYCLVVNPADAALPIHLAATNKMSVVCMVDSAETAAAGRKAAWKNGLSGRIAYHVREKNAAPPYRNYIFNAILLDRRKASGKTTLKNLTRLQRPCGGVLAIVTTNTSPPPAKFEKKTGKHSTVAWKRRGKLRGGGDWTHPYASPGNTLSGNSSMEYGKTGILWFGRPGPHDMPDRHTKGAPPVYANGRLYVSGTDRIFAIDAYNGTILWEKDIKNVGRVIMPRNTGNMVATDSGVYVAYGGKCDFFDGDTGKTTRSMTTGLSNGEWGYIGLSNGALVGSTTPAGAQYRPSLVALDAKKWFDSDALCFYGRGTVACSKTIFAFDTKTGRRLWKLDALVPNPAIALDEKHVYLVRNPNGSLKPGRIGMDAFLKDKTEIVAVDLKTGRVAWKTPVDLKKAQWTLYTMVSNGVALLVSSGHVEIPGEKDKKGRPVRRIRYFLNAFDTATGKNLWNSTEKPAHETQKGDHGELNQHPMIIGDIVMGDAFARRLRDGAPYKGWIWSKGGKCGLPTSSRKLVFSRNSKKLVSYMANMENGESTPLCLVARPGCWVNIIPAGGLVLVPEATSGCTCGYAVQTSRAFIPLPDK